MRQKILLITDTTTAHLLPRIQYLLDFLNAHPVLQTAELDWALAQEAIKQPNTIQIYYGAEVPPANCTYSIHPLFELIGCQPPLIGHWALQGYNSQSGTIYGVETEQQEKRPFFSNHPERPAIKIFGFDWLATLFFHLSRIEEYAEQPTDDIGIMPGEALLCYRSNLHHRPLVDELVVALVAVLNVHLPKQLSPIIASHDLDILSIFGSKFRLFRYLVGSALRYKTVLHWPSLVADYVRVKMGHRPDPADTFDWLLNNNQAQEKYLFLGVGNQTKYDHFPELETPRMVAIRDFARQQGYQIGLHPSFDTWKNAARWMQEKAEIETWIGAPIHHSRQHFLRFAFPETADILEQAGMQTDSTLGFRRQIGFRCGTGFPFHLYNFKAACAYTWKEIPLVVMDIGLLREAGFGRKRLEALWLDFLKTNQFNTQINLNFHNTVFYEPELAGIPLTQYYQQITSCAPYSILEPTSTTLPTQV